jgi:hypothetical protein
MQLIRLIAGDLINCAIAVIGGAWLAFDWWVYGGSPVKPFVSGVLALVGVYFVYRTYEAWSTYLTAHSRGS